MFNDSQSQAKPEKTEKQIVNENVVRGHMQNFISLV